MTTIVPKSLSPWAMRGLDLTDSAFSKAYHKEIEFDTSNEVQFDLEPERFNQWRTKVVEKAIRIYASDTYTVAATKDLLTEYATIAVTDVVTDRDTRWNVNPQTASDQNACDDITDQQIKAKVLGMYIHNSLTEGARQTLNAENSFFEVKDYTGQKHYDGPSYFYKVASHVDPNNEQLIDKVKKELSSLDVKNFNHSIAKMSAQFTILSRRVIEYGGTYTDDEKFRDMWKALATMKEKVFTEYVQRKHDDIRDGTKAKGSVDDWWKIFKDKEISMRADEKWNVMSQEDALLIALMGVVEGSSKKGGKQSSKKSEDTKKSGTSKLTDAEKKARKEAKYPDWKKKGPAEGESTTKEVDGRTYHYCKKCRDGEGLWSLHKETEHTSNFKQPAKSDSKGKDSNKNNSSSSNNKKKVGFNANTKKEDGPTIKVNKDLLKNAKAYLAKFSDFQDGGAQAS